MEKILKSLNPRTSIRARLSILFVIMVGVIFSIVGITLQWRMRNLLEAELGKHLETVANMVSIQLEAEIIGSIRLGDESTRSYRNTCEQLRLMQRVTGVRRIFLFNTNLQSIADTEQNIPIGQEYIRLKFDSNELSQTFAGRTTSSILFTGMDDRLYKSAYAPIWLNEEIIAAVGVEGSAQTLEAIENIRRNLLTLGFFVLMGSLLVIFFIADRITVPLKRLQTAAAEIGRGNYQQEIRHQGQDEIAFLSRTLDEMRRNIIRRERQQKAMLAGVAHEIRNPLGGIELFAGILSDDLTDELQQEQMQKILKEVKNLKNIVQNFLDYARPVQPNKQNCSPRDILIEVLGLLAKELDSINIDFRELTANEKAIVDPQHLKQVFINLVQNAIQVLPREGILKIYSRPQKNGRLALIFEDNGPGIPQDVADKIFDPFFTTRESGTGLGLSIVKNLLEENGGTISLLTKQSGGAVFEVVLEKA